MFDLLRLEQSDTSTEREAAIFKRQTRRLSPIVDFFAFLFYVLIS